jgi:hypothetical protein
MRGNPKYFSFLQELFLCGAPSLLRGGDSKSVFDSTITTPTLVLGVDF